MNHPTTIKQVLEAYRHADPAPRPAEFDDAWYAKLEENKKKLLETALQDITRIIEDAVNELNEKTVPLNQNEVETVQRITKIIDSLDLKKVIGE